MKKIILSLTLITLFVGPIAHAEQIEGREFPAEMDINGKKLALNGMGVRKVNRFGLNFKVYAGALYLSKKTKSRDDVLNATEPVLIKMSYLRRVDKKDIAEALETGHSNNCKMDEARCTASKKVLKQLTDKMTDLLDKSTFELVIYPDKVDYNINGRQKLVGTLMGADIAKNILGIYFGDKPASEELRDGFLALK